MLQKTSKCRIAAVLVALFVGFALADAQAPGSKTEKPGRPDASPAKTPDPTFVRWKIFLDGLIQEARTVSPEERRPYAVAEVANAYWEIDRDESQAMFITALDAAWKLAEQDKKYHDVVDDVLTMASKLDVSLAKLLTKRISDKQEGKKSRYDIAGSNLYELLKEDPQMAAQLAEAFAPDGLPLAAPNFILSLAKVDLALANRVYAVYVDKVAANNYIPLKDIITLCPYAFGNSEYYYMDKTGGTAGATLVPVKGFAANRRLALSILRSAYRRLSLEITQRNNAVGPDIEGRTWGLLFATQYLTPEVARFDPSSFSAWEQLGQQAKVGATAEQIKGVEFRVASLFEMRARVQSIAESAEKLDEIAEARLADVEKIVGTCERDVVYMKSALTFSYRKNFTRARELLAKVEGEKRAESLRNIISYDMAIASIENSEWDDAELHLKKISNPLEVVITQIRLSEALIKKNDKIAGGKIVDVAAVNIEKLPEVKDRTGLYFSLASVLLKVDPVEARTLFGKAVKNLNKLDAKDTDRYFYHQSLLLSCTDDKNGEWWGGSISFNGSSVLQAVPLFAKENPDQTSLAIDSIGDKVTRIRAQAILARIALLKVKKQPAM